MFVVFFFFFASSFFSVTVAHMTKEWENVLRGTHGGSGISSDPS
jgi:hypothetical protein